MSKEARRAWSRPELIVLVRSGPEEAVLGPCKNSEKAGGYQYGATMCGQNSEACTPCANVDDS